MRIAKRIDELIGDTPLLCIDDATEKSAEVVAKLEYQNPGGSVKDRFALSVIREAEANGTLKPGGTIVEATSGNTGIGLAMLAAACGYKLKLTMPESMSTERKKILKAYGAELVLTPGEEGMKGAIDKAEEIVEKEGGLHVRQFDNAANLKSHYTMTGPEIWTATEGRVNAFVAAVGTGGTLGGTGKYLKEQNPDIAIVAVEPADSAVLSGEEPCSHLIQGIGTGFIPSILNTDLVTCVEKVTIQDTITTARELCSKKGVLCGISSGAIVWAARKTARNIAEKEGTGLGKRVVCIIPSNGERYLSTVLFEDLQ
ncbi:MAG: cysteine synthase A [Acidobacteria bacterium]|nr:MAG: cysteine synthase A [Acidobacteriota bacterium]